MTDDRCVHDRVRGTFGISSTPIRRSTERGRMAKILVSPRGIAHFEGCDHKDDSDFTQRGEIDIPNAWERLRNKEQSQATGDAKADVVATRRCPDCENHGPW